MTEMELKLSGGRIVSAEVKDGVLKIWAEMEKEMTKRETSEVREKEVNQKKNWCHDQFVLVPASSLSLTDKFLRHEPQSERERVFKKLLTNVIKSGVSDFYRPKLDPSVDREGNICYQAGLKPAVGKSYIWWEQQAKKFYPERKSRLGTKSEYIAFLGVLLKKLVESGWKVDAAWHAVCEDSKKFGHYWLSEDNLHDIELTGSREICGYFDLSDTYKILADDEETGGFWIAGGFVNINSRCNPIAALFHYELRNFGYNFSVGWLVLS